MSTVVDTRPAQPLWLEQVSARLREVLERMPACATCVSSQG